VAHAGLTLERVDALRIGGRVAGALEHIGEVAGPAAVVELVGVAHRRNGVGPEHVLAPLGERLPLGIAGRWPRIELGQVLDHVRQVLNRAVVEIVACHRGGQVGRGIPGERADRRRAGAAVFIERLRTAYLPPVWGWLTLLWMRRREYS